jgi:hypothetical protein
VVFLFATELATKMGFTDDCYTDGRDPSVTLSVLFLPTECITVTDGIIPSAKLYNVVVNFMQVEEQYIYQNMSNKFPYPSVFKFK